MLMKKQRKNSFFEIDQKELSADVGENFVLENLNPFLLKTMNYLKNSSFSIMIIKNTFDNTFCIYEDDTKQLLVLIDKLEYGKGYFCKPSMILHKLSVKILESFKNDLIEGIYESDKNNNLISDLFFMNELPDNEKLSDYLYQISLLLAYQFNLDITKSKVIHVDEEIIIIDGNKYEFVLNTKENSIQLQEVVYMINIRNNSNFVNVVKIFEDDKKETHILDLNEYLMQDFDFINE